MKKIGIVFDLDGTLVDSLEDISTVVNFVRRSYELPKLEPKTIAGYIGNGLPILLDKCFADAKEKPSPEKVIEEYRHFFRTAPREAVPLYPGVAATLRRLQQQPRIRLGICTNKLTEMAVKTLEEAIPDITFDTVMGPDKVSEPKPSKAHLLETLLDMGCDPADAWYVGDHEVDAQCAADAGVRFLAAMYGFGEVSVAPEAELHEFPEILEKINTHEARS